MAKFEPELEKVIVREGGRAAWHKKVSDKGGETYCGASRRYHPTWKGWKIVDAMRTHHRFPDILAESPTLRTALNEFYRDLFWAPVKGDEIESQEIAGILFDFAINSGPPDAGETLQEVLNCLNRNGASWPELNVDGDIGPKTLAALSAAKDDWDMIPGFMRSLRVWHLKEFMRKNPDQEINARGLIRRALGLKYK